MLATMRSLLLLAVLASTTAAQAPTRSFTSSLYLFGGLAGSALSGPDLDNTDAGAGWQLGAGFGLTPELSIVAGWTASMLESEAGDYSLQHFDVGARYTLARPHSRWVPFLDGSFTWRHFLREDAEFCGTSCVTGDFELRGTAGTLGGGVHYFTSPQVALTTSLRWSTGSFNELRFAGMSDTTIDAEGTSARFGLGVTWFPGARRAGR